MSDSNWWNILLGAVPYFCLGAFLSVIISSCYLVKIQRLEYLLDFYRAYYNANHPDKEEDLEEDDLDEGPWQVSLANMTDDDWDDDD